MKSIVSMSAQYLLPKMSDSNRILVAVMAYTKGYGTRKARTNTRIPVETKESDETIQKALWRGMMDEVAKDKTRFEFEIGPWFFAELLPDEEIPDALHLKIAYEVVRWNGRLRDFAQLDTQDRDEYHGPIEIVEVDELLTNSGNRQQLLYSHGKTIASYVRRQANMSEEIAWVYRDVLGLYPSDELNEEEVQAIEDYLKSH